MQEFDPNENPGVARSVGEIVDRVTLLVHDEIELAKAELMSAVQNLVRGTVAGVLGGIFAVFGLVIFLQAVALFLNDLFDWDNYPWLGYLVVAMMLFIFGALAAFFAAKKIKKGSQLTPEMAIEEARKTQEALRPPEPVEAQVVPATAQQATQQATQPTTQPATKPATQQTKPATPSAAPAKPAAPAPGKPAAPAPAGDDKSAKRAAKEAAKAKAKAEKQRAKEEEAAAKAKAKADKEAAKARAEAEQQAEKARKQAEKQAEKDRKQAEKAAKKAGDKKQSKGDDQPPKAGPPAAGGN